MRQNFTIPVALCISWLIASSLWINPHSLSYFNELIGGPRNGPNYLLGSNVDWGQDLRYLRSWLDRQPEVDQLGVSLVGFPDTSILKNRKMVNRRNRASTRDIALGAEYRAISVNHLWEQRSVNSGRSSEEASIAGMLTFNDQRTTGRVVAGYSIYVFTRDDFGSVRQRHD